MTWDHKELVSCLWNSVSTFPVPLPVAISRIWLHRTFTRLWGLCWTLGVSLFVVVSGHAATLHVTVEGVQTSPKPVRVLLFTDPDTFPDEEQPFRAHAVEATHGVAVVEFTDLSPGTYAIMAYHDENADNRLNRTLGMWPSEGYGLSRNPLLLGPPTFQDAAFELPSHRLSLTIVLQY